MRCLLVAASSIEIAPFIQAYNAAADDFPEIDVLISGIGLMSTTYALTKQILIKRPEMIIQAGLAGGFDKKTKLGTVIAVKQEIIADMGVMERKDLQSVFDMKLASPNQFPFSNGWLSNKSSLLENSRLKKVKAISINEITTSPQRIEVYKKKFNPFLETMEGAAAHYVCLMEKIPFIQIRSISNYVGERVKKKWMLKESVFNLNTELTRMLYKL